MERWDVTIPTNFQSELVREIAADAPTIFGIGLETLTGMALGGGGIAAALGIYKIARRLLSRNRKGGDPTLSDPFPRRLDEARQLREIRQYTERRSPEYDAAVGRIMDDEFQLFQRQGTPEAKVVLSEFRDRIRDRVDRLMPPSTREYITEDMS